MNVQPITLPVEQAQAKLAAYKHQLTLRADAEYQAAVTAYEALAQGHPLLDIREAITGAGVGTDGRPKLAIARADRAQVKADLRIHNRPAGVRFDAAFDVHRGRVAANLSIFMPFPLEQISFMSSGQRCQHPDGYALVPMIPADVRPRADLTKCHILWEVEKWSDTPLNAVPDRDPYLLRHVIGDLYAVLAQWELTDLERAIMSGRRDQ